MDKYFAEIFEELLAPLAELYRPVVDIDSIYSQIDPADIIDLDNEEIPDGFADDDIDDGPFADGSIINILIYFVNQEHCG